MNDSLMISGQWINKYTNEVVNVINNVIDGDELTLVTDKGVITMSDFADYIQLEPGQEVPNKDNNVVSNANPYQGLMIQDDDITAVNNSVTPQTQNQQDEDIFDKPISSNKPQKPKGNQILDKFFSKVSNIDKLLEISINDAVIPVNDLSTIITYMDIKIDDISNYIIDNILDKKYIANILNIELEKLFGEKTNSNIEVINSESDES